jgi:hypothetical protein
VAFRGAAGTEAYSQAMRTVKPRASPTVPLAKLRPLLKPVVDPVIERLDRTEKLVLEMKAALDVQFKRTAEIQAQLDIRGSIRQATKVTERPPRRRSPERRWPTVRPTRTSQISAAGAAQRLW